MSAFTLYFGGAEQQGWRRLLAEQNAPMSVSFRGLMRRLPKTKKWLMSERMAGDYAVLLDSGGHSFNSKMDATVGELETYSATYEAFVADNTERPDLISEFDAIQLGLPWIEARREEFYDHLDRSKFMPIWHADWGVDVLRKMAEKYEVIGITSLNSLTGSTITPILGQLARAGVRLHGVALTKPDILRVVPFTSAASTSWLSPNQYGDTIVWDGTTLHRYPKAYKDRARRQHKMLFERAGFDPEKIMADDNTEVLRFTLWSWMQQATAIAQMRRRQAGTITESGEITDSDDAQPGSDNLHNGSDQSVIALPGAAHQPAPSQSREVLEREERVTLPVIGIKRLTSKDVDADGNEIEHTTELMEVNSTSARACDHCFVADICVMFRPQHACAYDIPVSAETHEQRVAIMKGIVEMQTQRVAFGKMAEDMHGGYPDPNLSAEIDRLSKLQLSFKELTDDRDSFEMTVRARGSKATMMERIFGREAPPRHGQIIDVEPGDPLAAIDERIPLRE